MNGKYGMDKRYRNSKKGDNIVSRLIGNGFIITYCMHFLTVFFSLHFI